MSGSLANPRAKLERAQEHLEALDGEVGVFFESVPYEVVGNFETETGGVDKYLFRVKVLREPPLRLGAILGDFIHNVRSALDQLVWQLVQLDGGRPGSRTCFPVARTAAEFDSKVGKTLKGMTPEHVARIEELQPYHAGDRSEDHLLVLLSRLSNVDKHRVLHPTLGWFRSDLVPRPKFFTNEDACIVSAELARIEQLEDGAVIARAEVEVLGREPEVWMEAEIEIDIGFGEGPIRAVALGKIGQLVNQVIESFAPDFVETP